jgi:polyhydroxyalkanoate synthesis regulator phasin
MKGVYIMSNAFEKSINLGLGILLYSREKVEEFVEELVSKGEVSKNDARQFAGELVQRGEEQREELKKLIRSEVTKALEQTNLASQKDLVSKDELRCIVREEIRSALQEQKGS